MVFSLHKIKQPGETSLKTFKGNLTKLTTAIKSKLAPSGDLYNYPGVSRDLILETCDQIYNLASSIEPLDSKPNIEIITLKRLGGKLLPNLYKFIEEESTSRSAAEKFDEFVERLTRLYEKTKQVYFIVNLNGLRNDQELLELQKKINDYAIIFEEQNAIILKARENAELVKDLHGNTMKE